MNDWKWTTKVGLVVALLVIGVSVASMYQYADENDLLFTPNTPGIMLNFLLWWGLAKWALDAAAWVVGKLR